MALGLGLGLGFGLGLGLGFGFGLGFELGLGVGVRSRSCAWACSLACLISSSDRRFACQEGAPGWRVQGISREFEGSQAGGVGAWG